MWSSATEGSSRESFRYVNRIFDATCATSLFCSVKKIADDDDLISFKCMDRDLNFIIGSAIEYHGITKGSFYHSLMSFISLYNFITAEDDNDSS